MELPFALISPKRRYYSVSCFWIFLIVTTFIQSIGCGTIRPDWDLAITHGQRVTFFSVGTTLDQVFDVTVPTPTILTIGKTNSTGVPTASESTQNFENEAARNNYPVPNWSKNELRTLALNPSRNLVFFTSETTPRNLTYVCVFNITSNKSYALFRTANVKNTGIVLYDGSLYWTDTKSNSIIRIRTENDLTTWNYEIFYQPKDQISSGLLVDAKSSTFFWSAGNKIQYFRDGKEGTAVGTSAHSLAIDDSYLYWASAENSAGYSINKVSLGDFKQQARVHRGKLRNIYSMSVVCGNTIAWTDLYASKVSLLNVSANTISEPLISPREPYATISKGAATYDWSYCEKATTAKGSELVATPVSAFVSSQAPETTFRPTITQGLSTPSHPNPGKVTTETTKYPSQPATTASLPTTHGPILQATGESGVGIKLMNSAPEKVHPATPETLEHSSVANAALTSSSTTVPATTVSERVESRDSEDKSTTNLKVVNTTKINASIAWCPKEQLSPCLNGGTCVVVENTMYCLCLPGFMGRECEKPWSPEADSLRSVHVPFMSPSNSMYLIICSSLLILVVILTAAVIVLYVKVRKLDKKPKIRRRVIVSRSGQRERGSSVCELIDIENCCNMNECETPCYDRGGPSTSSSSSQSEPVSTTLPSNNKKSSKEDKERLIDF